MAVTYISIERVTGASVFETDQSDPPLTRDQADVVAEQYNDLLVARLEEAYPEAEIELVAGNGLGSGTRVDADDHEEESLTLSHLASISQSLWESPEVWGVVAAAVEN